MMEMNLHGNSKEGYFISSEDDGDEVARPELLPCPICGDSDRLTIHNTHTPSFWVECECGCQVHAWEGPSFNPTKRQQCSKRGTIKLYTQARNNAVDAWNTRDGSLQRMSAHNTHPPKY